MTPTPAQFLLTVLACYAISLFVSKLSGPGHVFAKLRGKAKGALKEGISCPLCLGTWVAFALTAYEWWQLNLMVEQTPVYAFAVAGGNALLHLVDPL